MVAVFHAKEVIKFLRNPKARKRIWVDSMHPAKWMWRVTIHLLIKIQRPQEARIKTWIISKQIATMNSFSDLTQNKLICDQTYLTRAQLQVKTLEVLISWVVCLIEVRISHMTGVSTSRETSLIRLTKSLKLNKEMKQTMTVMCLWVQIVILPKIILMRKRCIEISIASKIRRRKSKRERLKNKNSSLKFKQKSKHNKIF